MARQREKVRPVKKRAASVPAGSASPHATPAKLSPKERILDAAEELLGKCGPEHTTVVDVARHLGMSHANVYKHFPTKVALRDAVAERWLHRIVAPLEQIAAGKGTPEVRLRNYIHSLALAKRKKVLDDPEMFSTYHAVAEASREVVARHLTTLRDQIGLIIADGVAGAEFTVTDPSEAAMAILNGTVRYHHPHLVMTLPDHWKHDLDSILSLLIAGLKK